MVDYRKVVILSFLLGACGGSDGFSDRPEVPAGQTGCTVIAGPPGSDEFILRCADGTESLISGGEDGSSGSDGVCSVVDHEDGTKTISCADGTEITLENGQDGAPGERGEKGASGDDGEDGTSCSVADQMDGTKLVSCTDGTSVVVSDGQEGATGPAGEAGEQGVPGMNGADGQDGTDCSVADNGDGTKTISCTDGTTAVVADGEDGMDGADGRNVQIVTTAEPAGPNCEEGGNKIEFYIEGDVNPAATTYQCNTPTDPCQPGWMFSPQSGRCVPAVTLRWEGVLTSQFDMATLPGGAATTEPLVTEPEELMGMGTATPCSGTIAYPFAREAVFYNEGPSSFFEQGMSVSYETGSSRFEFGDEPVYHFSSMMGGSSLQTGGAQQPLTSDLQMEYILSNRLDFAMGTYPHRAFISMTGSKIQGFGPMDYPTLTLNISGRYTLDMAQPKSDKAPGVEAWLETFAGVQNTDPMTADAFVEFNTYGASGGGGTYRCRITSVYTSM